MNALTQDQLKIFEVNDCIIDVALREINYEGDVIRPDENVFDTLIYLIENRDHVVNLDEFRRCLWKDDSVSEFEIIRTISHARRAILDSEETSLITYHSDSNGYQFEGDLLELEIS